MIVQPIRCLAALALLAAMPAAAAPSAEPAMLPARLLTCTLGHAMNLDPHKDQKRSEVIYEGHHRLVLFLPAGPARTTPPPDAIDPPEPVDPRTRVLADPDGLLKGVPARFDRVIDLWPERVEMTTTIEEPTVSLMILSDISKDGREANLFMTRATDAATLDLDRVYSGPCTIGPAPDPAA